MLPGAAQIQFLMWPLGKIDFPPMTGIYDHQEGFIIKWSYENIHM